MPTNINMQTILIKALGMENASPEKQNEVVESMGAIIYQAVIARALEEMDDKTVDEFEKLTDGAPTPDMLIEFFTKKIPNFEKMMKEEAIAIVTDSVNVMGAIEK